MMRALRAAAMNAVARITNWGLTALRNGQQLRLSREEIRFSRVSFSQFGEDQAIIEFVDEDPSMPKVYVDAGCFHPIHHSNTLLLHKRGWRGVNIDLQPATIEAFQLLRPGDVNVVAACSDAEHEMVALSYGAGVTDRLAPVDRPDLPSLLGERPIAAAPVRTTTLNRILEAHGIGRIGYLNIDCEGHDFEVLKGLDLARYAPAIISIEVDEAGGEVQAHLERAGYYCRRTYYRTQLYVKRAAA